MKVKTKWPEYEGWCSERQLAEQGKTIVDPDKAEMLWTNSFCKRVCVYAAPDNVRDMTEEEKAAYKDKCKEKVRERRQAKKDAEFTITELQFIEAVLIVYCRDGIKRKYADTFDSIISKINSILIREG